ncbi:MAG: Flp pilus assembly complex ATPase component TadA [Alphaproteobacteria bacterium]|nr:MAG: Flp pilus assembly complex ATPase component TadA [Alphaproteobacteria bacterium]
MSQSVTVDHSGEHLEIPKRQFQLALAEQGVHAAKGRHFTIPEILQRNGFYSLVPISKERKSSNGAVRDDLTAQGLRLYVPASMQTAMGICLLELRKGVLRIAAGDRVSDDDVENIRHVLQISSRDVNRVEIEPWDRADLARLMREQSEVPSERLLRIFNALSKDPDDATLVEQAVNDILAEALQLRSSDIHLTLLEEDTRCWIRYRVDGDIMYRHLLPHSVMAPIATRIKTDAKMDAADRQHPQDGRLGCDWQGHNIDVRVACLPIAPAGEKLTLRLLDRENLRTFNELFAYTPNVAQRLRRALHGHVKDGGIIIVSGPTGSGKSTTLYGVIQEIDRSARAVYSIEAPVEYEMPLVDQTSVTDNSANTIADMIRALMRHDPDVIIIGEMRDGDTVEAALRATESGHLVVTTLHAVDAIHTIDRIDGFLASSYRTSGLYILGHALVASISQRLIKTVCPACHEMVSAGEVFENDAEVLSILEMNAADKVARAHPGGCDLCNHTGFLGRALLLEALFPPDDHAGRRSFTEMILANVTSSVTDIPGTLFIPRSRSIADLMQRQVVDANMASSLLFEEMSSKRTRESS